MSPESVDKIFTYNVDKHLTDILSEKEFSVSAEVIPPRNGESQEKTMGILKTIVGAGADFLSVTKGAGGSLRGGSLPITQVVKDHFTKTCIAHFTCRDLTPQDVENQLVDHHYFGVRNILALRGDPPMEAKTWTTRDGGYDYAYQLIRQVRELNEGSFIEREGYTVANRENTDFCIGCAVYPEHPDPSERLEFAKIKFNEGAQYGITQMIFDPEVYHQFVTLMATAGVSSPIIPGIRILRSQKQGRIMRDRFGCSVPDWYLKALPENHHRGVFDKSVLPPFFRLVESLKKVGAPGVHIFVLNDVLEFGEAMAVLKPEDL